jgi:hypothetical protein
MEKALMAEEDLGFQPHDELGFVPHKKEIPGSSTDNPVNESPVGLVERFLGGNLAPNPQAEAEFLGRKPGEGRKPKEYRLAPKGGMGIAADLVSRGLFGVPLPTLPIGESKQHVGATVNAAGDTVAKLPDGRWGLVHAHTEWSPKTLVDLASLKNAPGELLDWAKPVAMATLPGAKPLAFAAQMGGVELGSRGLGALAGFKDTPEAALTDAGKVAGGVYVGGKLIEGLGTGLGKLLGRSEKFAARETNAAAQRAALEKILPEKAAVGVEKKVLAERSGELGTQGDQLREEARQELLKGQLGRQAESKAQQEAAMQARQETLASRAEKTATSAEQAAHMARASTEAGEYGKEAARVQEQIRQLKAEEAGPAELPSLEAPIPTKKTARGMSEAVKEAADRHGVDPTELRDIARQIWEEQKSGSFTSEQLAAMKSARKVTGLTPSKIAKWEDAGKDHSSWPGLDQTARDMAPEMGWMSPYEEFSGADTNDYGARLWELLRETPKTGPAKYSSAILDEAARHLKPSETPKISAPTPSAVTRPERSTIEELMATRAQLIEKARETRSRAGLYRQVTKEQAAADAAAEASRFRAGLPRKTAEPSAPSSMRAPRAAAAEDDVAGIYRGARERAHEVNRQAPAERHAANQAARNKAIDWDTAYQIGDAAQEWAHKESSAAWDQAHQQVVGLLQGAGLSTEEAIARAAEIKAQAEVAASLGPKAVKDAAAQAAQGSTGTSGAFGAAEILQRLHDNPRAQAFRQARGSLAKDKATLRTRDTALGKEKQFLAALQAQELRLGQPGKFGRWAGRAAGATIGAASGLPLGAAIGYHAGGPPGQAITEATARLLARRAALLRRLGPYQEPLQRAAGLAGAAAVR